MNIEQMHILLTKNLQVLATITIPIYQVQLLFEHQQGEFVM